MMNSSVLWLLDLTSPKGPKNKRNHTVEPHIRAPKLEIILLKILYGLLQMMIYHLTPVETNSTKDLSRKTLEWSKSSTKIIN